MDEPQALRCSLARIFYVLDWLESEKEVQEKFTRLICYYQGNHKASSPLDLWTTKSEFERRRKDIIEGNIPIVVLRKLTDDEAKNWVRK